MAEYPHQRSLKQETGTDCAHPSDGLIGIFWVDEDTLIPFPVNPLGPKAESTDISIDSSDAHWKVWDKVTALHPHLQGTEYEDTSRGRIIFKRNAPGSDTGRFIIYASSSILDSTELRQEILEAFGLLKVVNTLGTVIWQTDEHYEPPWKVWD